MENILEQEQTKCLVEENPLLIYTEQQDGPLSASTLRPFWRNLLDTFTVLITLFRPIPLPFSACDPLLDSAVQGPTLASAARIADVNV